MNRECEKCVYHTSGSCSHWECKGVTTVDDIRADERKKTIKDLYASDKSNTLKELLNQARADERAKTIKSFIDCEEDLRHLENQMKNMFEEWNCFNKLSKLESMGIDVVMEGLQTVGYLLGVIDQIKEGAENEN